PAILAFVFIVSRSNGIGLRFDGTSDYPLPNTFACLRPAPIVAPKGMNPRADPYRWVPNDAIFTGLGRNASKVFLAKIGPILSKVFRSSRNRKCCDSQAIM